MKFLNDITFDNEFHAVLAQNIVTKIKALRKEGITGMTIDCLKQNVKTPAANLGGAPMSPAGYERVFKNVFGQLPANYKAFVYQD